MTLSTRVGNRVETVLERLSRLEAENRYLRRRVRELTEQRNRWRVKARLWKWGALH